MPERRELAHYVRIAVWLEQPRLPGVEREYQAWLDGHEGNRLEWQQWQHMMSKARRMHADLLDVESLWVELRDSLGLHRKRHASQATSSRERSAISRLRSFFRRPIVVAIGAMIALGAFFFVLYWVRLTMGF